MRNLKNLLGRGLAALLLALLLGAGAAQAQLEAYVANFSSNTVSVIDTATNTVTYTIPVGTSPQFVAFTPDGAFAYVANTNGRTVSVIDRVTRTVIATVPSGGPTTFPVGVRVSNDGAFAYVLLNEISGNSAVSVIDTATNTVVATIPITGALQAMTLNPSGTSLWVGDSAGRISVIDTATQTVTGTFSVGISVADIAFTPDGAFAYMTQARGNNVVQVDTASQAVVATFSPGRFTIGVAITPDGSFAYVVNLLDNNVAAVDINNGNTIVATIPVGAFPAWIALTPDGAFAYVTNQGGNTTSVIDTATNTVVATVPVGSSPAGIAIGRVIAPPNCSGAVASPSQLWPPNHNFVPVQISGVTNPDGGALTISVTGIFQDEPTDSLGDGNTCPDGTGTGTATANLRAERNTLGNGRVYTVDFTATGAGGSCQGSVTVCVPKTNNGSCGNGGALFNSGACTAPSQASSKALTRHNHNLKGLLCGSHLPTLNCDLFCDASLLLCH